MPERGVGVPGGSEGVLAMMAFLLGGCCMNTSAGDMAIAVESGALLVHAPYQGGGSGVELYIAAPQDVDPQDRRTPDRASVFLVPIPDLRTYFLC